MKRILPPKKILFFIISLSVFYGVYGQVGINTTTPNGALDITSSNYGVVLPRVSLNRTDQMAPAVNPQSGAIPVGTAVFNTNTTTTHGEFDVVPGIYSWNGSSWTPQFNQKQSELFESGLFIRTRAGTNYNINNLTSRSFTADFSGVYRVKVSVNFGGGGAKVPNQGTGGTQSDGNLNIARASGVFTLNFNGNTYTIPAHSYSTSYDSSVGATNYFAIWQQFESTFYETLSVNETVNFTLQFRQDSAPEFEHEGGATNSSSAGRGYVAYDIPCTVEITYVDVN